ncbi:MAG TPA: ricin-type beta-trefoil lectin domain protein [Patescibacteria group bacterium]|nr:ricin-type beta-trefoil lectin domain protein [Patescibacteria group bacterium]
MKKISPRLFYLYDQNGTVHHIFLIFIILVISFIGINVLKTSSTHAKIIGSPIKALGFNYCLDDKNSGEDSGTKVDAYKCNDTSAQDWFIEGLYIKHGNNCLTLNDAYKVLLDRCSDSPNQRWLTDYSNLLNPYTRLCLTIPSGKSGVQLEGQLCQRNSQSQSWKLQKQSCSAQTAGGMIACSAIIEWQVWQKNGSDHLQLLTKYTDGAPTEEWCADFVSYVYKEAGLPFNKGEVDGWDENNANNIVNQGFSIRYPAKYIPKAGDIGYFSYGGGHVEIVVAGGVHPTFIYGNSSKKDPQTGNGEMATNSLTRVGEEGSLEYYLVPNI